MSQPHNSIRAVMIKSLPINAQFPAEHIETSLNRSDLVLDVATASQVHEIEHWLRDNTSAANTLGAAASTQSGFRALFHGVAGSGKTLTAALLGKMSQQAVVRVDLSRVVSRYIGETEKNLKALFDRAQKENWILFFDEADALFGKRTEVRDAHDRFTNQEVSYLLQRIETFNGVVILATNKRANIDDAFVRRLQSVVHFPARNPP